MILMKSWMITLQDDTVLFKLCHTLMLYKWQIFIQQETIYFICAMSATKGRATKEVGGQNKEAHMDRKEVSWIFFHFLKVVSIHKWNNMSQWAKTISHFFTLMGWPNVHSVQGGYKKLLKKRKILCSQN